MSPLCALNCFRRIVGFIVLFFLVLVVPVRAQDHTVIFSTSAPGVSRAITNWGIAVFGGLDVIQSGLIYMGSNQIDEVLIPFTMMDPLTNGQLSAASKTQLNENLAVANLVGTKPIFISSGTADGVNSWYITGANRVDPNRWASNMIATQLFLSRPILWASPFNEPDYGSWNQGSPQDLYDIMGLLQSSTNFSATLLAGGTTLNDDNAVYWYDFVKSRAAIGTTHCLGGSFASYVNWMNDVNSSGGFALNPEAHNLMEVIAGAQYGLKGAIWWLSSPLARGSFVNACQGQQLGYADDWPKWTAAAVYRGTNGTVQAFLGGSERMGVATSYRFFSKNRDVFYDGNGPQRDYTVSISADSERVVNITWGADVQPVISGRYIVVNRFSGKAMEVPGASVNNGVTLDQNSYSGASNQQWDIYPLPASVGGDLSYYTMTAAHDGVTADESNFSYNDGNAIIQWNGGTNAVEQWFFQYAGNGYFYIRSRWSGKYLDVSGPSLNNGASIVQWSGLSRLSQQWRLMPAGAAVEFVAPAAPAGVIATANAVTVQLNWNANTEPDLASYTVLRATNSGGPYEICARGLTNNAFTDKEANQPKTYYYVVQAVDRSLNASGNSAEVSATPTGGPAVIAHYPFDGNFNDSSGNANPALATGLPAFVAGEYGSAMGLNGASQYAMLSPGLLASTTNFTIAAWVYWNGGATWQRIFDFGNDTTQYLFLTPNSGNGTLRFAISTSGPGGEQIVETGAPMASNQWIHVAVTCDGSTGRLYTNGVLAASDSVTINPAGFNPLLNYLGKSQFSDPLFSGNLDEVLIANYALSSGQIAWLLINDAPLPTLVHRYNFNETSGAIAHDSIGGAAWNGTLPNGGTFNGGQLTLSSVNSQYLNLPPGILSNYSAVTIEAWATFPDQIAWNTMFFGFGNTVAGSGNSYLFCAPQSGRIAITSTNYTGEQNAYSGIDFSFHANLHLTAVFNPAGGELRLYTNGILAGINAGITTSLSAVSNVFSYIGRSLYTGDVFFNFSIDEFRIYNGVMQPADIAAAQLVGPNVLLTTNVSLSTSTSGSSLTMSWPVAGSGFTLESSPVLGSGAIWAPMPVTPSVVGVNNQLTITPTNGTLFFRLER